MSSRPSWVPDWTHPFHPQLDPTPFHRGFSAYAHWMADHFDPAPDIANSFQLKGIYMDSREESQLELVAYANTNPAADGLLWYSTAQGLVAGHARAGHLQEDGLAVRTTLVAAENAERDVASVDDLAGYDDAKEIWQNGGCTLSELELNNAIISPKMRRASRYALAHGRMSFLRRFFLTIGGRIGLGPQNMRVGDFVTILYGGEWPFVLRRSVGKDEYTMVGSTTS